MTENKAITLEQGLYLLALGLALALRLIGLGALPFNETEADWAYQAYQVAQGQPVQIGSQPAYVLLTGLVFFLFSSSEAWARLLPALMGGLVVVLPFVLRERLGRKAALVAAFGLALDPVMVAVSRQAGSPMLAVGFAALAAAAWLKSRPGFAGIFTALFLLSGLGAVPAVLGAGAAAAILFLSGYFRGVELERPVFQKSFLTAFGLTLLVLGTLWMRYPSGLSAMMQAVPDYLRGWSGTSGVSFGQVLVALPLYQPVGLLFAVFALLKVKTWETGMTRVAGLLGVVMLGLVLVYPSREVSDLVWVLPLLWLLAGWSIAPHLRRAEEAQRLVVWGQALTILALLAFWWSNLVKAARTYFVNIPEGFRLVEFNTLDYATRVYLGRMAIVVIVPLVIALMAAIVIANWSKQTALQGALRGFGIFAIFYLVMVLFGISDLRPQQANELWNPPVSAGYADDLRAALAELSEPDTGNRNDLEVVYQLDMALLHWQLRDMPNARYAPVLGPEESPAVLINKLFSLEELGVPSGYRGEKIALQLSRSWGGTILPADFDRWFIYREGPIEKEWVVLWAREDLFVGFEYQETDSILESGEPAD